MERSVPTTGAKPSKPLSVEDLGAIPNLMDRLTIEKVLVKHSTWIGVARELHQTELYKKLSGHIVGRVSMLALLELDRSYSNAIVGSKPSVDNASSRATNSPHSTSVKPSEPIKPGLYSTTPVPKEK